MPQLIGLLIVLYLIYLAIKYIVIPGLAIASGVAIAALAAGLLWGLFCSFRNFIIAVRNNMHRSN